MKKKMSRKRKERLAVIILRILGALITATGIISMIPSILSISGGPIVFVAVMFLLNNIIGLLCIFIGIFLILLSQYISDDIYDNYKGGEE